MAKSKKRKPRKMEGKKCSSCGNEALEFGNILLERKLYGKTTCPACGEVEQGLIGFSTASDDGASLDDCAPFDLGDNMAGWSIERST